MYCKECGFQLSRDAKFCPSCGTKVELNGIGDIKQKAVFGRIESDDATNVDSEPKRTLLDNGQGHDNKVSEEPKKIERKKIIRTDATTSPNVFVSYYSYEDDKSSVLSTYWYVDSKGLRVSENFENLSLTIINGITMVSKHGRKWACGRFEYDNNSKMRLIITTRYVFDDVNTWLSEEDGALRFLLHYNRNVYSYNGKRFYKMKEKGILVRKVAPIAVSILVGVCVGALVFSFINLIYNLLCGLNLKDAMNAPIGTGGVIVSIILILISIVVAAYYILHSDIIPDVEYKQVREDSDSIFIK